VLCCGPAACSGYTWGQCNSEAQFSDRRWQMTVMDKKGSLYVLGGEEIESGRYAKQSDVWKATVSMSAARSVLSAACPGIRFPGCTPGFSCWPGTATTIRATQAASCPVLQQCNLYPGDDGESSTADDNGGDWPVNTLPSSSSGPSAGVIVLIVVLVLAGVGGIACFLYYRRRQSGSGYRRDDGLLLASTDGVSSLPSDTPVVH
jgi:hypothetical protein